MRFLIAVGVMSLAVGVCLGVEPAGSGTKFVHFVHMANGIKIGEVSSTSAIIWTRLTKHPERNINGASFSKRKNPWDAENRGEHAYDLEKMDAAVPGVKGQVRITYWLEPDRAGKKSTGWLPVLQDKDFTRQVKLEGLSAGTRYSITVEGRGSQNGKVTCKVEGGFNTAPKASAPGRVSFTVVTGQEYGRRDDPMNGHKIYPQMLGLGGLGPDFFVHTGDIEYYDKAGPYADNVELARFKWNRIYAMPFQRRFHNETASYFIKDDHDTLRNDCWPGQNYGDLTWEQGLEIFREQVPMGAKTYRTIRWGKDLQIWLVEGRDFRSPNNINDGPDKTIWGKDQKKWFFDTVSKSDATFRVLISATPIVGPDRGNKNDNHANRGFTYEGDQLRQFIGKQKNMFIICGDRHWQYVSVDPATGAKEYSCGPTTDKHAGGFSEKQRTSMHRYLKVKGGFLSAVVDRVNGTPTIIFRHHGVDGKIYNEDIITQDASIHAAGAAEKHSIKTSIDWSDFLSRHDMHWTQMPTKWNEAPFLGNGMMGTMIRQTDENTVRWDVGRGDVQDHRPRSGMYGTCRLPIGYFMLKTVGKIKGGTMKLDLWNAEATGEIQTDKGSIGWRSFVHAERMVIAAVLEPSEGERECRWEWKSLEAISPRHVFGKEQEGYKENLPSVLTKDDDVNVCIQPLLVGGQTATAWRVDKQEDKSVLIVSVAHSFPETTARQEAVDVVNNTRDVPMDKLVESHRRWWHAYYPKSFVSIPDTQWESFYWIQMYKLASATRANGMLIDNQGPWLQPTPWPGIWWNLNVQLTYWPTYASNRMELGSSLGRVLYSNVENLINNVPDKYSSDSAGISRATGQHCIGGVAAPNGDNAPEIGLLLWACHNCWLHYRHTMDDETLRNDLFPLLRRAVNYHLHFVTKGADGKFHLPKTYSPEYNYNKGPDCNFDLALLRWGCGTLIDICGRLSIDDPLLSRWKDIAKNLTDYPTNENGYMIADGVPFSRGHRHYSHLLMLYPLYLVNVEQPGSQEIGIRSVRHWQSLGSQSGYSLTGASSISAAFGLGNDALEYLNGLKSFLQPNTMYKEAGPVIETPLSGAQCIHDMVVQSWGQVIRIFPAAPDAWGDIVFDDLRTQGAFLVSARRTKGKTLFVRIKSLAGEPCRIMPGLEGKVQVSGSRKFNLKELKPDPGVFELDIKKGEQAILWSGDKWPDLKIAPIPADENKCNSFGLK